MGKIKWEKFEDRKKSGKFLKKVGNFSAGFGRRFSISKHVFREGGLDLETLYAVPWGPEPPPPIGEVVPKPIQFHQQQQLYNFNTKELLEAHFHFWYVTGLSYLYHNTLYKIYHISYPHLYCIYLSSFCYRFVLLMDWWTVILMTLVLWNC